MAKEFDRVKFSIPDAPGTGTVTVGTRSDNSFFLPTEQGAVDGDQVYYVIQKSNKDTEVGVGTIASSATEVSRDIVLSSIISGTAGTSKINIDASAFMAFVTPAYALKSLRVVRTVTGASDTFADNDGMGSITYDRATAIAATLPQAGASGKFLKGWFAFVSNVGAGSVTITPTTSTVNDESTLVLPQNLGAMIWSDGTNYRAIKVSSDAISGPASAVSGNIPSFTDTTGKSVQDSGVSVASLFRRVKTTAFTSSGTYTPSTGMVYAIIECVGGGGGGGGVASSGATQMVTGGGGGGGEYARKSVSASDVGASKAVTIGAAGTGGSAGNNAGVAGGDTSVGTLCIAKGGTGGGGNSGTEDGTGGGAGGTGGTGDVTSPGQVGDVKVFAGAFFGGSGGGGDAAMGFGFGAYGKNTSIGAGLTASGFGGGGGAGISFNTNGTRAGGNGTAGYVIITEFLSQ